MHRTTRRILALALGLTLGWCAAGFLPQSMGPASTTLAEDMTSAAPGDAAAAPGSKASSTNAAKGVVADGHDHAAAAATGGHDAAAPGPRAFHEGDRDAVHAQGAHESQGLQAANMLEPQGTDLNWYGRVILAIVGLFIAALALGSLALAFQGEPPPDPADDAHGHDAGHAHGHDAGHGHGHDAPKGAGHGGH